MKFAAVLSRGDVNFRRCGIMIDTFMLARDPSPVKSSNKPVAIGNRRHLFATRTTAHRLILMDFMKRTARGVN